MVAEIYFNSSTTLRNQKVWQNKRRLLLQRDNENVDKRQQTSYTEMVWCKMWSTMQH